jgi:hypothetical protein
MVSDGVAIQPNQLRTIRPASNTIYIPWNDDLLLNETIQARLTILSASIIVCNRCATVMSVTSPLNS